MLPRERLTVVLLCLLGACTQEGGLCRSGVVCDGAGALVCIDHHWVAQRCKQRCSPGEHGTHCDLVDDPRVGESCYFTQLNEGRTSSQHQHTCSADGKSVLDCRPPDGLWTATPCDQGSACKLRRCERLPEPAPSVKPIVVGQPYFVDGVQLEKCEDASPPVTIEKGSSRTACWYAGSSCEGHGAHIGKPFSLSGSRVSGATIHGGCNLGTFALVYERGTSPLKLRVCERSSAPVDCPAMVDDGASWDIGRLLQASHATKGKLVVP